jgi:hypothetical protein
VLPVGGVPSVVLPVIEASFVPVVVVLVFVCCAEMAAALATSASTMAPERERILTVVFLPRI